MDAITPALKKPLARCWTLPELIKACESQREDRIVPAFLASSDLIKGVRVHLIRVVACRKNGFPNRSFFLVACFMGERCKFVDLAF